MFKNLKIFLILIVFSATNTGLAIAQNNLLSVKYIGIEKGLSNNIVNSLYFDHFGFMWMGTYDGLNRYDGYNFKVFRNNWGVENSLVNNHITALNGDQDRIWIGTQKGLSYYSYLDGEFHNLKYLEKGQQANLSFSVNSIAVDKGGNVFIATDEHGLFMLKKDAVFAEYVGLNGNKIQTIKALCADEGQDLWFYAKDYGLCRYNVKSRKIQLKNAAIRNVTKYYKRKNQTLWIGTNMACMPLINWPTDLNR